MSLAEQLSGSLQEHLKGAMAAAILGVERELNPDGFIKSMMKFPEAIRLQQDTVEQEKQLYRAAKGNLLAVESVLMTGITLELDPGTGKKKFSNAEAREGELEVRKQTDSDYLEAFAAFQKIEEAYNAAQFDLQKLMDEFKAHQIVGEIMAARLNLRAIK